MDISRQAHLIQKYLDKQCNEAELVEVFSVLQTNLGKKIMQQKMDEAMTTMVEKQVELAPDVSVEIRDRVLQGVRLRKRQVRSRAWMRVAAVTLLLLATAAVWYQFGTNMKDRMLAANQKEIQIENGKISKFTLPDGTMIQARGGSQIKYADHFNGMSQRRVRLQGEAYFEVAKNAEKPFIIQMEQATIQVIGTAFNVKESKIRNEITVAVTEGKVRFKSNAQEKELYLKKQQVGVLKSDGTLAALSANSDNYLNWFSGRLAFDKAPLTTVIQQLAHIYDVNIIISDDDLSKLIFTADMKSQRIQTVLEQISTSLNITYTYDRTKNAYILDQLKK